MRTGLSILQAAPRPSRCGVTDSSLAIQAALRAHDVYSEILCLTDATEIPPGFKRILSAESVSDIRGTLVVQLSPYGFQSRGVPYSLMRGLRRFAAGEGNCLIVYFHETWASSSSPFKSPFWLEGIQRAVCRQILEASALALFSSPATWSWGASIVGKRRTAYCPTFSNIGEPDRIEPWLNRNSDLAVFGSLPSRLGGYTQRKTLTDFVERHHIGEILDIGPPMDAAARDALDDLPVRFLGQLPASEVSARLQTVQFGIFTSPWGVTSKSGVFAAYQAHGVVPVSTHDLPDANYQGEPGPVLGRDFIRLADDDVLPQSQLAMISHSIKRRYREHGVDALVRLISERVALNGGKES